MTPHVLSFFLSLCALSCFFIFVPRAFELTVLEHLRFNDVPLLNRVRALFHPSVSDFYLYTMGASGIIIGLIRSPERRPFCLAALLAIIAVLLPQEFFPHYYTLVTLAFVFGSCVLAEQIASLCSPRHSGVAVGILVCIITLHCNRTVPSLLNEWRSNRNPSHHALIQFLKEQPGPIATFMEPIYAVEANKPIPAHYYAATMRLLRMTGERYTESDYNQIVSSSCVVVLTPADKKFLPPSLQQTWASTHESRSFGNDVTVLLNKGARCSSH